MGQRLLAPAAAAVVYRPSLVARIPVGSAIGQDGCRGCSRRGHPMLNGAVSCNNLTKIAGLVIFSAEKCRHRLPGIDQAEEAA